MYKLYCRVFQNLVRAGSYLLGWYQPELLTGAGSVNNLYLILLTKRLHRVFIVTDQVIVKLGLMEGMLQTFTNAGIEFVVYDKTTPNPTIDNIEEALLLYKEKECQALIAFGGGSAIDCAKGVGARIARPKKQLSQMKGLLKIWKKLPFLVAIPTTSGTGSEATLAAVVTNGKTREKYPLEDIVLIPKYAVLDPTVTLGLPSGITATTGMDALTHAIEAYIGRSNTKETKELSLMAVKLIFENLYEAYNNGHNLKARENMQLASYYAGAAFTRAYVGNVHAIAHTLGGFYGVAHGLANAVILPYVLEYYGASVYQRLSELAHAAGIAKPGDTVEVTAINFIQTIRDMNRSMNIPEKIKEIEGKDLPLMIERAYAEANPIYPVPVIFTRADFTKLYYLIKE